MKLCKAPFPVGDNRFPRGPDGGVVRRGLERYAPRKGYDPGPIGRDKLAELVVRKAGLFPGDWVLDVQTGEGLLGVNVARAFTRAKVIATESDPTRLGTARENAKAEGCDARMRFILCSPDALPLKEESFWFATVGLRLAEEEEPLDTMDEVHRVTGYMGKVYCGAVDLRKMRPKKPRGVEPWIFDDEALEELKDIGFGKIQVSQVSMQNDGSRLTS
jgi:hypothetical protein